MEFLNDGLCHYIKKYRQYFSSFYLYEYLINFGANANEIKYGTKISNRIPELIGISKMVNLKIEIIEAASIKRDSELV